MNLSDYPKECNDNGYGGVCTYCGDLHTATVYYACQFCLRADTPDHVCKEEDYYEVMGRTYKHIGNTKF